MCVPGYHRFSVDNTDTYYECVQHSRCLSSQGQRYYGEDVSSVMILLLLCHSVGC